MNASNCGGTCVFAVLFGNNRRWYHYFPATFPAHHERRHATVRAVREVPYRYHRKWVVRTSTGINGTRNSSNVDSM